MSFRVKTTHKLLDNATPPKPEKPVLSFLDSDEKGEVAYLSSFLPGNTGVSKKSDSQPNQSSSKGMAIRTITSAQADHM